MPLVLPPGVTAVPATSALDAILAGPRVTDFRVELLSNEEVPLGTLDTVVPGGMLTWDYNAAIKGSGSMAVVDAGVDVDWLNVRLRIVAILEGVGVLEEDAEVSVGVYLPSAPVEDWSAGGRIWTVELLDKNAVLDQDIVTDPATGDPITYTAAVGVNVIAAVVALIVGAGEIAPAILPGSKTLAKPMTWDLGTSRLKIINDLLDAAGYFSLWCDGAGQYQANEYVPPAERGPVYDLLTPFAPGGLMSPDWTRDRDIYSIPNRYVAVGQGDGDAEGLVAVATNTDPDSPFSYPSRGRWITHVITGAQAVTQADLNTIAKRGLTALTSVTTVMEVKHVYLPELLVNRTVRFVNPDAGLDMLCVVSGTTLPLNPVELCTSTLREAVVNMEVV